MFISDWLSIICASLLLLVILKSLLFPTLRIPGPFSTSLARFWYLRAVNKGDFHHANIELHRRKGKVVRLGPDLFSFDDPDALKIIYGHGSNFEKSDWYDGFHTSEDITMTNLFTERDSKRHGLMRRKVASLYSMSALVSYEGYVDNCIQIFHQRLDEFCTAGTNINFVHWLQCYAFDVIGELSFGERFGFLDAGQDIDNIMESLDAALLFGTNVALFVGFRRVFLKLKKLFGGNPNVGIVRFAEESVKRARQSEKPGAEQDPSPMVKKLLDLQADESKCLTDWDVFSSLLNNIGAGSDTTAIGLSAVLFYVLKTPAVLEKLRQEIDAFSNSGFFSFKQTQSMEYLQVVIKEALRMHPGTGLPLWRRVPEGGKVISGYFFPENTNVGVNSWVAHRNTQVFGEDADTYRPERWLEADAVKLREMERSYMPFGLGSRTCIGKNISLLEINKLVPVLLRDFDFELTSNTGSDLESQTWWFAKPTNLYVKVSKRWDWN